MAATINRTSRFTNHSLTRKAFLTIGAYATLGLAACSSRQGSSGEGSSSAPESSAPEGQNPADMSAVTMNPSAWSYDATNDVYYQIGVQYCAIPEATEYESMGVYVPGPYFQATDNGNGTYTCTVAESGTKGDYTATTAPIVLPVNTAGYSAQAAPTSYDAQGLTDYIDAGFVYVFAGCRGRVNGTNPDGSSFAGGAPWGVTDLKAAVRCLRYNDGTVPGNKDAIFTFGHSGGGAQSALMGVTGDSELYIPYLEKIGAVMKDDAGEALSDSITGAMCWCPITSLDVADEAYEWMMGQYASTGTRSEGTFTASLSNDLAQSFVDWVNQAGLMHDGETLALSEGGEGIGTSGTYHDYLKEQIERSLNNFLADTTFPYTPSSSFSADGGFGGGGGTPSEAGDGASAGTLSGNGDGTAKDALSGKPPTNSDGGPSVGTGEASPDGAPGAGDATGAVAGSGSSSSVSSTTYETVDDYIATLNTSEQWVSYDAASNTATITSVGAFVRTCKMASKDVGAFDAFDRSQAENDLFGTGEQDSAHFDVTMSELLSSNASEYASLSGWDEDYPSDYASDLELIDGLGTSITTRANMYNPLYYLLDSYEGHGTSTPAPHWRIRTGIEQGDTSLTTELNLALALEADTRVSDVDFETVWGLGHTMAERTGNSTSNFIEWVKGC